MESYKYSFWYCTKHNTGFVIRDNNTQFVPDWHKMCCNGECCETDWYNKGIIEYDGIKVIELEKVQTYYGGGYNFIQYILKINDIHGSIELDDDEGLMTWFNKKNKQD